MAQKNKKSVIVSGILPLFPVRCRRVFVTVVLARCASPAVDSAWCSAQPSPPARRLMTVEFLTSCPPLSAPSRQVALTLLITHSEAHSLTHSLTLHSLTPCIIATSLRHFIPLSLITTLPLPPPASHSMHRSRGQQHMYEYDGANSTHQHQHRRGAQHHSLHHSQQQSQQHSQHHSHGHAHGHGHKRDRQQRPHDVPPIAKENIHPRQQVNVSRSRGKHRDRDITAMAPLQPHPSHSHAHAHMPVETPRLDFSCLQRNNFRGCPSPPPLQRRDDTQSSSATRMLPNLKIRRQDDVYDNLKGKNRNDPYQNQNICLNDHQNKLYNQKHLQPLDRVPHHGSSQNPHHRKSNLPPGLQDLKAQVNDNYFDSQNSHSRSLHMKKNPHRLQSLDPLHNTLDSSRSNGHHQFNNYVDHNNNINNNARGGGMNSHALDTYCNNSRNRHELAPLQSDNYNQQQLQPRGGRAVMRSNNIW